jgi:hypothetical protein
MTTTPTTEEAQEHVRKLLAERPGHILDASPEELEHLLDVASVAMETKSEPAVGIKYDGGKPRWDLLPYKAVSSIVDVLTYGAKKYKEWNWLLVEDADDRYFAAAMRHMVARRNGEILDPETKLPHLAHAACCILFSLHFDVIGETK